jgi:large subunit ribosomal protein L18
MDRQREKRKKRWRRHRRVRRKVAGDSSRPRLCVFRSLRHIYAQVIDDMEGKTLISSSTLEKGAEEIRGKPRPEAAAWVGRRVAEKAQEKGIKRVSFDRGGYKYHGRVRALADAARKAGLDF